MPLRPTAMFLPLPPSKIALEAAWSGSDLIYWTAPELNLDLTFGGLIDLGAVVPHRYKLHFVDLT